MAAPKPRDGWQETTPKLRFDKEDWMRAASCRSHPEKEIFFPERGNTRSAETARHICAGCPVWRDCLSFANQHHIEYGIWGGLSVRDRVAVRVGKVVKKCIACGLIRVFPKAESKCEQCRSTNFRRPKLPG